MVLSGLAIPQFKGGFPPDSRLLDSFLDLEHLLLEHQSLMTRSRQEWTFINAPNSGHQERHKRRKENTPTVVGRAAWDWLFSIAWLFDDFGKLGLALPTLNSIAVLGFMLVLKRKLWRHAWFWGTMAVIAALHVPLILFGPWWTRWVPALAIAVVDSLDFCLILWILAVVAKFMGEPKTTEKGTHSL